MYILELFLRFNCCELVTRFGYYGHRPTCIAV